LTGRKRACRDLDPTAYFLQRGIQALSQRQDGHHPPILKHGVPGIIFPHHNMQNNAVVIEIPMMTMYPPIFRPYMKLNITPARLAFTHNDDSIAKIRTSIIVSPSGINNLHRLTRDGNQRLLPYHLALPNLTQKLLRNSWSTRDIFHSPLTFYTITCSKLQKKFYFLLAHPDDLTHAFDILYTLPCKSSTSRFLSIFIERAFPVFKAGTLSYDSKQRRRGTARFILSRFPLADGLLARAQFIRQLFLSQSKMPPQGVNTMLVPPQFLPFTHPHISIPRGIAYIPSKAALRTSGP
jgi:hypothetical protein